MRQSDCGAESSDPSTRESCDSVAGAWVDAGSTARPRGGRTVLSSSIKKDRCGASHCDYRSAPQLFGLAAAGAAQSQTPAWALAEQSGGEFTSTHTRTGTAHASIQIVQASAAIPVCSRNRQLSFPTSAPSTDRCSLPRHTPSTLSLAELGCRGGRLSIAV